MKPRSKPSIAHVTLTHVEQDRFAVTFSGITVGAKKQTHKKDNAITNGSQGSWNTLQAISNLRRKGVSLSARCFDLTKNMTRA